LFEVIVTYLVSYYISILFKAYIISVSVMLMSYDVMARSSSQLLVNTYTINAPACLCICLCISVLYLWFFMLCLYCSHLLPAYAYLSMLMVSYLCLCMLRYVICVLTGYNISEGIFYWDYRLGKKEKYLGEDLGI
jgi:hypothetical protein